jgi:hypothetical protein
MEYILVLFLFTSAQGGSTSLYIDNFDSPESCKLARDTWMAQALKESQDFSPKPSAVCIPRKRLK